MRGAREKFVYRAWQLASTALKEHTENVIGATRTNFFKSNEDQLVHLHIQSARRLDLNFVELLRDAKGDDKKDDGTGRT